MNTETSNSDRTLRTDNGY